jgi:hypothetical protein
MADHELGAAAYAIWAAMKSVSKLDVKHVAESECRWQQAQLSGAIRELVLSDQQNRNPNSKMSFLLRHLRFTRRLLINSEKMSGFGSSSPTPSV